MISAESPDTERSKCISRFFKSDAYEFLLVYFNFLYYIGFSPMAFHFDWDQHKYKIVTSKFRKTISALLSFFSWTFLLSCARSHTPSLNFKNDPLAFFDSFTQFGFVLIYLPTLIYVVWAKQGDQNSLLEISLINSEKTFHTKSYFQPNKIRKNIIFTNIILGVSLSLLILSEVFFNYAVPEGTDRNSFAGIIRGLAGMMLYNLHFQEESVPLNEDAEMSWYFISIVIFYSVLVQYAAMLCFFFEQVPLLASLTIYSASNKMEVVMRENKLYTENEVLQEFFWHKVFVKTLNSIVSPVFLATFFATMPIFPKMILDILDGSDYFSLSFLPSVFIYIFLAAKSSNRYEGIKAWILETNDEFMNSNSYELIQVFSEASTEPLGLSVGSVTQISYKFIATGLGMLMTYAVVILQFSTNKQNNS